MVNVFSIPAFFIVLREVLEACLVVGIVLAYLDKLGATQYKKWVWFGAGGGVIISVIIGLAFGIIVWRGGDQLFEGNAEKIFEGVTFLIAAALLTWMIVWLMVMGNTIRAKMERQVEVIIEDDEKSPMRTKLSIFLLVFVQVLREGVETVIFLIGSANAEDSDDAWRAIPLPGVLAIIVGLALAYLVFKGLVNVDIIKFFWISGLILIAFAAGLVSHAFHEIQEVDAFGQWETDPLNRDWHNAVMWSTKGCCHDKENEFFAMLRALFGYQDTPTFVEWATYFAYWLIIAVVFIAINWQRVRAARSKTLSVCQNVASWALLFTFVGFVFTLINVTWVGVTSMALGLLLSILSVVVLFDSVVRLVPALKKARRAMLFGFGVAWAALLGFMFVMHLVELACEGSDGTCGWRDSMFFYFGLIFNPDFNATGRSFSGEGEDEKQTSWPAIAVLAVSFVVTTYFFGALSFSMVLASTNVDSQGDYLHDDAIQVKEAAMGEEDGDSAEAAEVPEVAVEQAV